MLNRVVEPVNSPKSDFSSWTRHLPSNLSTADVKKYMSSAEELVLKYPGPALASAFMVGVLVAWWIKRK
jgi:hypothetical protein